MSGVVYYSLASGSIHIGRATGDPVPAIIIGAVGIKPNHAKIVIKYNGLFEISVCDPEAAQNTMINGKTLPKKRTKILNHLDRICFAGSVIYVFYYPLLNTRVREIVEQNAEQNAEYEMDIRIRQAQVDIEENGMPNFDGTACPGYQFLEEDKKMIDWDMAYAEVEACIEA